MEDLDRAREVPGAAARILRTLESFGFEWDGPVLRQCECQPRYEDALRGLSDRGLTFACTCSRLQLEDDLRYPGTCRNRLFPPDAATALRLRIDPAWVQFTDRIQGTYRQDVSASVGDVILKRRDRVFAYVLAVVVDDAAQGITDIVRGADLLDNTPRQIYLQRLFGSLQPTYAHVAVLMEEDGSKLAKSRRSIELSARSPLPQLLEVFALLNLRPPPMLEDATLAEAWMWARDNWDMNKVPRRLNLRVNA